jgi:hypothetical protein
MNSHRKFEALVVAAGPPPDTYVEELSGLGGSVRKADNVYDAMTILCGERLDMVVIETTESVECAELLEYVANSRTALLTVLVAEAGRSPMPLWDGAVMLSRPLKAGELQAAVLAHYKSLVQEKREQIRVPLRGPVTIMLGPAQYIATANDIGHEGMGVRLPHPLPFREILELSFELPGKSRKIRLSGEISWIDGWGHAGIHLLDMPVSVRQEIAAWITERPPQEQGK